MNRREFLAAAGTSAGAAASPHWTVAAPAVRDPRPMRQDKSALFAIGKKAMVSTSHPLATEAGVKALKKGGTAADAYVAAAITQAIVEPELTTLAGGLGLTYYDAKTKKISQIAGGFTDPKAEVPGPFSDPHDYMTGRTFMVPGFIAAAQDASKRWGRLPWRDLFEDAIHYAREGFVVDHRLFAWVYEYSRWLGGYPEGRELWFADGYLPEIGSVFRQTKLAATLERLAEEGADYFYKGPWARKCVDLVRSRGGRVTLEDMAGVQVHYWDGSSVYRGRFREYDVVTISTAMMILALNLVEEGNLRKLGRPTESVEALYYQIRIVQEAWLTGSLFNEKSADVLLSKEYAKSIWQVIEKGPPRPIKRPEPGTCAIVVIDENGNTACGTHSITSSMFGLGLFVDGIVLNRITYLRKYFQWPSGVSTSLTVFKNGRPALLVGSPSGSYFMSIFQNTVNVLEYGMDLWESVNQPRLGLGSDLGEPVESTYGEEILNKLEKRVSVERLSPWLPIMGNCQAIWVDHDRNEIHGVSDRRLGGMAKGY